MTPPIKIDDQKFGIAIHCTSLDDIKNLIKTNTGKIKIRLQVAMFGMVLITSQAIGETEFYADTINLLDQVARAKTEIDIASCHDIEVVEATAFILLSAQRYVDETTFPCTEWPFPGEVAEVIFKTAKQFLSDFV